MKFAGSPESLEKTGGLEKIRSNNDADRPQETILSKTLSNEEDNNLRRIMSAASHKFNRVDSSFNEASRKVPKKFVEDETKEKGVIKRATWAEYISGSGGTSTSFLSINAMSLTRRKLHRNLRFGLI